MTFLIVEDDPFMADLIERNLRPLSSEILRATTMQAAMEIIRNVPTLNIITLDLNLSDSHEHDTLARIMDIKRFNSDALVIVITGVADMTTAKRAIEYGADGLVEKNPDIAIQSKFLTNLYDVCAAIARQPERYKKNISMVENISAKITDFLNNGGAIALPHESILRTGRA